MESIVLFEQLTRGLPDSVIMVSAADAMIVAANEAAERELQVEHDQERYSLWSVFDSSEEARTFLDACARTLSPVLGALHRGETVFRCTGWRVARDQPNVVLRLAPREKANRFALLSQKVAELNAEIKQRRLAEDALTLLQCATAELAAARTASEIAHTVLSRSTKAFGAESGALFRVADGMLLVIDAVGYPPDAIASFSSVSLERELPACEAIRSERTIVIASAEDSRRRYPALPSFTDASVVLPLRASNCIIGALGFGFDGPRAFSGAEMERMKAFAGLCAQALERALLFEAATVANRRKDDFMAMLGHELRNPLAPIHTALELMEMRQPTVFVKEREIIGRQTRHLAVLVDDMLDVTRIARGKIELHRRTVRLTETVQRSIDMVSDALERQRQVLDVSVDDIVLDADHDRLAQVLANLLDNACKYTPRDGRITMRAMRLGNEVKITVRDTGRGIEPSLLPRIFEPFVQDERTGARTPGGLGLGLAIVRGIVELHGGHVAVSSAGPGRGSEFLVRLPGVVPDTRSTTACPRTAPHGAARVLVVDDNVDAAEMLAETLAQLGYATSTAYDGPSALSAVDRFVPDIALVDLGMPVMDGYELAERLRQLPACKRAGLVAVTGYGQDNDRAATRSAGFDAHLVKPVTLEEVTRVIETLRRKERACGAESVATEPVATEH